jgi:hypothetical protein
VGLQVGRGTALGFREVSGRCPFDQVLSSLMGFQLFR